jgi:hypothetical protein
MSAKAVHRMLAKLTQGVDAGDDDDGVSGGRVVVVVVFMVALKAMPERIFNMSVLLILA